MDVPPPPPGFTLDAPPPKAPPTAPGGTAIPPPPPGFTLDASAQKQPAAPSPEHWWERMWQGISGRDSSGAGSLGMGMADPAVGGAQAGQHIFGTQAAYEAGLPEQAGPSTKAMDVAVQQREQRYQTGREKAGDTGFDWNRMWGNILSPVNLAAGAVPGGAATRVGQAGVGALRGAVAGAMQPATSGDFGTEKALQMGGSALLGGIFEPVVSAITGRNPAGVEDFIKNTYKRVVKPTEMRRGSTAQVSSYYDKARSAIDSIIDNKGFLKFASPDGETVAGRLPRSLDEFGEAIGQVKRRIFQMYDRMTRGAEEAGGVVDLNPIVKTLEGITMDPVVVTMTPGVARYAEKRLSALWAMESFSPTNAQRAIEAANASLKAFYRTAASPSVTAKQIQKASGKAGVDLLIADGLRKGLDDVVNKLVAPGYQQLKNQYGALRAIEDGIVKRAGVEGSKNLGGGIIGNLFDVSSLHDLALGLIHFDPSLVATGMLKRGAKHMTQMLRSPNRAVKQIFEAAEQAKAPPEAAVPRVLRAVPRTTAPLAVPGAAAGTSDEALRYAWPQ